MFDLCIIHNTPLLLNQHNRDDAPQDDDDDGDDDDDDCLCFIRMLELEHKLQCNIALSTRNLEVFENKRS